MMLAGLGLFACWRAARRRFRQPENFARTGALRSGAGQLPIASQTAQRNVVSPWVRMPFEGRVEPVNGNFEDADLSILQLAP
jgi:hypothetical protein